MDLVPRRRICRHTLFKFRRLGTSGGAANWGCGFLPTVYQGVPFRRNGDPILFLTNPPGVTPAMQRKSLDTLRKLNQQRLDVVGDPEITTRINSYEMAYRMQTSAPELMDIFQRVACDPPRCMAQHRARVRLRTIVCWLGDWSRRGVRFVQLVPRSMGPSLRCLWWCEEAVRIDGSSGGGAGERFEQRGLLEDTLVIWGGELVARRWWKRTRKRDAAWDAIIIRRRSRCGWRAVESNQD